jgi:hypothetical protein
MFNSVGHLIGKDPMKLRSDVVDYMLEHADMEWNGMTIAEWVQHSSERDNSTLQSYAERMRLSSEWGGCIELLCMSLMYSVSIKVILQGSDQFITVGDASLPKVIVIYNGYHYSPVGVGVR